MDKNNGTQNLKVLKQLNNADLENHLKNLKNLAQNYEILYNIVTQRIEQIPQEVYKASFFEQVLKLPDVQEGISQVINLIVRTNDISYLNYFCNILTSDKLEDGLVENSKLDTSRAYLLSKTIDIDFNSLGYLVNLSLENQIDIIKDNYLISKNKDLENNTQKNPHPNLFAR